MKWPRLYVLFILINMRFMFCVSASSYSSSEQEEHDRKSRWIIDREIKMLSKLDTADFIRYYGYPCESHDVITADKYILTVHRVPHGKEDNSSFRSSNQSKPVVFLQHGLVSYSGDWFLTGPAKALGFILADAGYDVWAGNARGNTHSRDHLIYDPNVDMQFWDFSWHEIGYYDLPAMIDYILDSTNQTNLFYVGHSQGTTVNYVLLSEHPEYNNKIAAQFSLSPIAFLNHLNGPALKILTYFDKLIAFGVDLLNINEIKHDNIFFKYFFRKVCGTHFIRELCMREIFSFAGANAKQFNQTLLPLFIANLPAGASMKQLKHFAQVVRTGQFAQYDYGLLKNSFMYGDPHPPRYNLRNVKSPIYMFCSGNDYLSSLADVKRLYWSLPQGNKHLMKVNDDKWNHVDYVWGIHAKELVYNKILKTIRYHLIAFNDNGNQKEII